MNFNGMKVGKSLPILECALLDVQPGELTVTAGNLEVFVQRRFVGVYPETFRVAVPFQRLADWIALQDGPFKFKAVNIYDLQVSCGRHRMTLKGHNPVDYPYFPPTGDTMPIFSMPLTVFQDAIKRIRFAVAVNHGRPTLEAICLRNNTLIASDGFRLAIQELPVPVTTDDLLISPQALDAVLKCSGEVITLAVDGQKIIFSTETETVYTVPVTGDYPAIERFFPKTYVSEVTIDSAELRKALKTVALFNHQLSLVITEQKDILIKAVEQTGDCAIVKEATVEGTALEIFIDGNYLIDGLSTLSGEVILKSEGKAGKLLMEVEGWQYLCMPLIA